MSTLKVQNIKHASSSSNNIELLSNGKINLPNNSMVLQAVSTQKTGALTFPNINQGGNTGVVSGFTRSITMSSSSNKVLVLASFSPGMDSTHVMYATLMRGSTPICIGTQSGGGNTQQVSRAYSGANDNYGYQTNIIFLDSPGSGTHTYGVRLSHADNGTRQMYFNRGNSHGNEYYVAGLSSDLTCLEISA